MLNRWNFLKTGFYEGIKLDELVSKTMDVSDANAAFDALAKGEVARSVLTFE